MSVLDTMRSATALVRQVTLCLDGALQAEYDALQAELPRAAARDDSLAQEKVTELAEQMNRIHDKMRASEVTFSFKALPWMERLTLQGEHPPRDDDILDRRSGHNRETYPPALIKRACASVRGVDGQVITDVPDDVWEAMISQLNAAQFDTLYSSAFEANDNATTVPPSARSLLGSQDSGASSTSPGPGKARRQSGGKGGSRSKSRSTSTTKKAASSA